MKKFLLLFVPSLIASGLSLAQFDPNLVGGGDSLGSGVTSPFADLGYASTDDYNAARTYGYGPSKTDATLWGHAKKSTSGNTQQISGSSETYGNVYTNLGNKTGSTVGKTIFQPVYDCTSAVGTPGYDNFADCQAAVGKGYALTDYVLYGEAKAANAALQLFCGEVACTTITKTAFQSAKTSKSNFDIDRARGSNGTLDGTLTIADFTTHSVAFPTAFNASTRRPWLIAYLNEATNQSGGNMSDSTHPTLPASSTSTWKGRAAAADLATVSWWYIQQFMAGNISSPGLSSDLFTSAGLGASYTSASVVSQVASNVSTASASDYSSKSNFQSFISTLITPTWVGTPATAIAKNVITAVSGSPIITHTASVTGGTITYSVSGANAASFGVVGSTGVVSTASNLAIGSYTFNLVATPTVGSAISKSFTVNVSAISPTWVGTPATTIAKNVGSAVDGSAIITHTATIPGSTITYSIGGSDGASFGVVGATGVVTAAGNLAAGTYAFDLVATPNIGSAITKAFTVNVNTVPVLASFSCGSGFAGNAYSCTTPSATDADGDSLTYTLAGNPSWLSVNASSGALTGTPSSSAAVSGLVLSVSDGSDTASSTAFSLTINANPGAALASTSTATTSAQVDDWATFGVSSTITADLKNNSTCGTAGNQSCLAAFNAQKATSSCSLPGSSASAAQLQTYIACVMIEHHTTVANATTITTPAASQLKICQGNNSAKAFPLPTTCGHSQWTCSVQTGPSSWSVNNTTNQLIVPASYASAGNVNVTIRMALGIYSPAYTKDVQKTYNMTQGFNSSNSYESSGVSNVVGAWNNCNGKGGRIMTCAETAADSNLGNKILCYPSGSTPAYSVKTYSYNSRYYNTPSTSCGFGSTANAKSTYNNYYNNFSCGNTESGGWSYGCTNLPSC